MIARIQRQAASLPWLRRTLVVVGAATIVSTHRLLI